MTDMKFRNLGQLFCACGIAACQPQSTPRSLPKAAAAAADGLLREHYGAVSYERACARPLTDGYLVTYGRRPPKEEDAVQLDAPPAALVVISNNGIARELRPVPTAIGTGDQLSVEASDSTTIVASAQRQLPAGAVFHCYLRTSGGVWLQFINDTNPTTANLHGYVFLAKDRVVRGILTF